jgi:hypothetical protein
MTDFRLDPSTHDLYVSDVGGTSLETDYVAGVRQRLMIRLQLFAGEWFLNTLLGVPYYRDFLVKNPDLSVIRAVLRSRILADPDVVAVPRLEMLLSGRTLSVDFNAALKDGTPLHVAYPPAVATTPWADAPRLPGAVTPAQPNADAITPWLVDIRLSDTHDLYVSDVGATALIVSLADAVRQRTSIRLQLFLGEWFLNTRLGIPYFRDVLVKNPDFSVIRALVRERVLSDPDVVAVPLVSFDYDPAVRTLSITVEAVIRDDTAVTVSTNTLPDNLVTTLLGDPVMTEAGDYVVTLA